MIEFKSRIVGFDPEVTIRANDEEHLLSSTYLRMRFNGAELFIDDNKVFMKVGETQRGLVGYIVKNPK